MIFLKKKYSVEPLKFLIMKKTLDQQILTNLVKNRARLVLGVFLFLIACLSFFSIYFIFFDQVIETFLCLICIISIAFAFKFIYEYEKPKELLKRKKEELEEINGQILELEELISNSEVIPNVLKSYKSINPVTISERTLSVINMFLEESKEKYKKERKQMDELLIKLNETERYIILIGLFSFWSAIKILFKK